MHLTIDTNILVRAVVQDDAEQTHKALKVLSEASLVALSLPCLCEFVWVLRNGYKYSRKDTALAIGRLLEARNVEMNRPAVEAGLSALEAGGDFADGVIAFEGRWMGGEVFVSFDRKAVAVVTAQGEKAQLL